MRNISARLLLIYYTLLLYFDGNFNTFSFTFEFKQKRMSSIKIKEIKYYYYNYILTENLYGNRMHYYAETTFLQWFIQLCCYNISTAEVNLVFLRCNVSCIWRI